MTTSLLSTNTLPFLATRINFRVNLSNTTEYVILTILLTWLNAQSSLLLLSQFLSSLLMVALWTQHGSYDLALVSLDHFGLPDAEMHLQLFGFITSLLLFSHLKLYRQYSLLILAKTLLAALQLITQVGFVTVVEMSFMWFGLKLRSLLIS